MNFVSHKAVAADPTAAAQTASNACTGKSKKHVVKTYYRGPATVVLRCGTRNWGYRHLVAHGRWSANFSKKIKNAIWSGDVVIDVPGQRVYERRVIQCPPRILFRVVTNPDPYGADPRIKSQGVITAYKPASLVSPAC
ncbi:hypothetical protein Strvi_0357 [Streptomyces violaceusniger Tu 4113]|uniref:Uncharacterized protein n=1 Tax=Streptomyces violaceusniger (strain Tu 4113) TaxID=653045 RepID=G2PB93_STRV4|nr:hypothetical protein Strvi_0357 [Streptomyces violaceusniger Tu 4113]